MKSVSWSLIGVTIVLMGCAAPTDNGGDGSADAATTGRSPADREVLERLDTWATAFLNRDLNAFMRTLDIYFESQVRMDRDMLRANYANLFQKNKMIPQDIRFDNANIDMTATVTGVEFDTSTGTFPVRMQLRRVDGEWYVKSFERDARFETLQDPGDAQPATPKSKPGAAKPRQQSPRSN